MGLIESAKRIFMPQDAIRDHMRRTEKTGLRTQTSPNPPPVAMPGSPLTDLPVRDAQAGVDELGAILDDAARRR